MDTMDTMDTMFKKITIYNIHCVWNSSLWTIVLSLYPFLSIVSIVDFKKKIEVYNGYNGYNTKNNKTTKKQCNIID